MTRIGAAFHLTEVLENFLIFVPMGIYLQMLLPRTKLYVKFMLIAGTSFLLETMQYILAVGRSDITDVLTNTAGGLLGLAVYSIAARLIGNRIKSKQTVFHSGRHSKCCRDWSAWLSSVC